MALSDILTFGLAILAYGLLNLALGVVLPARGPAPGLLGRLRARPAELWAGLATLAVLHAGCVWHFRFGWDPREALERGLPVFLAFHGAVLLIGAGALWPGRPGRGRAASLGLAWLLVAPSAAPAPWVHRERIPGILWLLVPVLLLTLLGLLYLGSALRTWRGARRVR